MAKGYSVDVKGKKCVTPECRGSYVHILEPEPLPESEKLAWGLQCVFPKNDVTKEWANELSQIYTQVLTDKFKGDKTQIAEVVRILKIKRSFPLRDGDNEADTATVSNKEQLKGCYFLNTHNRFRQPHVMKMNGEPIAPESLTVDDVYSGAWYRVMLEFWYYDVKGNKGISTSVAAVMKTKDDENLGGGTSRSEAVTAFSSFAEEPTMMFDSNGEVPETNDPPEGKENKEEEFSFL